jgi:aspartokinase
MKRQNIPNIREFVWKIIETDITLKKDLNRGIINVRSLAKHILDEQKITASLDSVISAIRRYEKAPKNKETYSVYHTLNHARIATRTKMSSLLLKRTDDVKTKLGRPDKLIDYQGHEIIRVLEGSQALTIVFDRKNFEKIKTIFPKSVILEENKKVGMIEIDYPRILKKTPGVFSVIYNELAENNISIIDALISSNEHILVIDEEKLLTAFEHIYELCNN